MEEKGNLRDTFHFTILLEFQIHLEFAERTGKKCAGLLLETGIESGVLI